jgi:hypothetical protein
MSNKQKNKPQLSKLILMISALVIISIVVTMVSLYLNYRGNQGPAAFFARDINDASYDCEDKINGRFKEQLVSKYYDEISSRYDAKTHQYVIYYRVSAREVENGLPSIKDFMAKCIVWEKLGYVSDFQIIRNF